MLQSDDQLNSPALRLQPLNATEAMKKLKWRFIFKGLATVALGAIVAVPIGLWLAFCPLFLQHYLLFYPLKYPVGQYDQLTVDGVKPTDVYFQSLNGSKLHGLLYRKKGAKNFCLFTHGNGGNVGLRQRSYQLLLREDCSVFVYDYQGYGKSEGSPDADKIIEDSNAAYEYATRTLGWDPAQMIIFGESLGTMLSTKLAAEHQCKALILECPVYSIKKIGRRSLPLLKLYPDWLWPAGGLDSSQYIKSVHAPVFLAVGSKDTLTAPAITRELFALANTPKTMLVVEGAGHGDSAMMNSDAYIDGLHQFMQTLK